MRWLQGLFGIITGKRTPPAGPGRPPSESETAIPPCPACGTVPPSAWDSVCGKCLAVLGYTHVSECRATRRGGGPRAGIEVVAVYTGIAGAEDPAAIAVSGRTDEDGIVVLTLTGRGLRPSLVTYHVDGRLVDGPFMLRAEDTKCTRGWVI